MVNFEKLVSLLWYIIFSFFFPVKTKKETVELNLKSLYFKHMIADMVRLIRQCQKDRMG